MKNSVNYDTYGYDYSSYWESRGYEQRAEELTLKHLFRNSSGTRFIDIGGSYGRLLPLYSKSYDEVVIIDYSIETLQKYRDHIVSKHPNSKLVAANAYHIPFVDNSYDGGLMVRVLHHLSDQPQYLTELNRVLTRGSEFIQEYANKVHLKARLKAVKNNDRSVYNLEPYQQPSQGNFEGTKGEEVPFLNYHPEYIDQLLNKHGFEVVEKRGCSYLRSTPLANRTPRFISDSLERLSQSLFSGFDISPSIFLKIKNNRRSNVSYLSRSFDEILRCPGCVSGKSSKKHSKNPGELDFSGDKCECRTCGNTFYKKEGIWDLRI